MVDAVAHQVAIALLDHVAQAGFVSREACTVDTFLPLGPRR
jgi:hypothetical protein